MTDEMHERLSTTCCLRASNPATSMYLRGAALICRICPRRAWSQKTDVVHAAQVGGVLGALAGAIGGILLVIFPPTGLSLQLVAVLVAAFLGALFGVWASSLAGAAVPNSKLKRFEPSIKEGRLLLMVDVPLHDCERISELVARRHPEAVSGGTEPTVPAFPYGGPPLLAGAAADRQSRPELRSHSRNPTNTGRGHAVPGSK